jgi:beta-lactamase class C
MKDKAADGAARRCHTLHALPPATPAATRVQAMATARRPRSASRFTLRALAVQTGLVALLLPLAAGLSAQTPLRWDGRQSQPVGIMPLGLYSPQASMARVYPGNGLKVQPLASGFDVAEFESLASSLVERGKTPGLAMAIVHRGEVLSARGYGVTDQNTPEQVDLHTVFRLASLSKAFASTTAGLLVADGSLRWDSRIQDALPTLQFSDPTAAAQLTVADVLSHRVGLKSHNAFDRDIESNAEYPVLLQKLAYAPMQCAPGQCYAYQNLAYSLIGDAISKAGGGQSYEQIVTRRLLRPLGMFDASIGLEGIAQSRRWAKPHVFGRGGWVPVYPKPTYYRVAPAAGVNASISDMAKWLVAHTGHRPNVLPPSLLATLHTPLIDTPSETRGSSWRRERLNAAGYGLGWRVFDYAGHRMVFHGGAVQGYRGAIAMLPERDLGVVLLWNSNSAAPSALLPTILDRAIGLYDRQWLESESDSEGLYAERTLPPLPVNDPANVGGGTSASGTTSNAQPR